jgi:DNA mismatch endonuclease (patch repair protein)
MPDIVDPVTRSRMMSGIRGRNTGPELAVRHHLHRAGLRYRLHGRRLPGRPDIVLPRYRAVVFVHGCFWHRHAGCRYAYQPKSNVEFWNAKFRENVERDSRVEEALSSSGWTVHVVWGCQAGDSGVLRQLADTIRGVAIGPA